MRYLLFSIISLLAYSAVAAESITFGDVTVTKERYTPDCATVCDRDLIIFVHGIFGSKETWSNGDTGAYWPQLIIDDTDLASFDVARIDYESALIGTAPSIEEIAKNFNEAIRRLDPTRYRTVQFVAHSLGGNLVKRFLLYIKHKYGHAILSHFRLVIFLGTPNDGSYLSSMAKFLSQNQQLRVLQPIKENDWLQLLNYSGEKVRDKHDETLCSSLKWYAAVENRKIGPTLIVSRQSAKAGMDETRTFEEDHISLAKPGSTASPVYLWTKKLFRNCSRGSLCPGSHRSLMKANCGKRDY